MMGTTHCNQCACYCCAQKAHVLCAAAARQSAPLHDASFPLQFFMSSKTDTMEAPRVGIFTGWFCYADYRSQTWDKRSSRWRSIIVRPANKLQHFPRFRQMGYKVGIIHSIELWGKTSNSKRVITCAGALFI